MVIHRLFHCNLYTTRQISKVNIMGRIVTCEAEYKRARNTQERKLTQNSG